MRILFVSRSTTGHSLSGGMEQSFETIAADLKRHGHTVSLLTTHGASSHPNFYEKVWEIPVGRPGRYSLRWWLETAKEATPWLAWSPDVVFSVSSSGGSFALRRNERSPFAVIAQCHGTAVAEVRSSLATLGLRELVKVPLNLSRIPREVFFYRRFTHVIAVGDAVNYQLQRMPYRVGKSRCTLVSNGVDPEAWEFSDEARTSARAELGLPSDATVGLTASRLHRQKGVDIAIDALTLVAGRRDAYLIVCGSGPEESALKERARAAGIFERVRFVGTQGQLHVARWMSAADLLVFPTRRHEGLPLSILEALANGLPVVTVANARVPDSLSGEVIVSDGDSVSVSKAWLSTPPRSGGSRLDAAHTLGHSLRRYEEILTGAVETISEDL